MMSAAWFRLVMVFTSVAGVEHAGAQDPAAVQLGGVSDGRGFSFGVVADVAIDSAGRIWILDRKARAAIVVDSLGGLLGRVGGFGRGPGEWLDPEAIDVRPDGRTYVLDGLQRRISEFRHSSAAPIHERDIRTTGPRAADFCLMADRLYTLAVWRDSTPIQEFRIVGDSLIRVRGLGTTAFRRDMGPRWQLMPLFASGRLTCVPQVGMLAWPARHLGELRLVHPRDTAGQRTYAITGFAETAISFDVSQNTVLMSLPASGTADEVVAATAGGAGLVITVGTRTQGQTARGEFESFYTKGVVVNRDGIPSQGERRVSLGILGAATNRLAVCYLNDPFPTVWVLRTGGHFTVSCPSDLSDKGAVPSAMKR